MVFKGDDVIGLEELFGEHRLKNRMLEIKFICHPDHGQKANDLYFAAGSLADDNVSGMNKGGQDIQTKKKK